MPVVHTASQVLALPEELCIAEIRGVRGRIDEAVASGARRLVLDLTATDLVTAAALRVFESTERRLTGLGGALNLRNPRPLPLRVLQITGFDRLLEPGLAR